MDQGGGTDLEQAMQDQGLLIVEVVKSRVFYRIQYGSSCKIYGMGRLACLACLSEPVSDIVPARLLSGI